ncbi:hypothetical protein [Abyssicoccus albus]|uniref:hypothetical protein n=1 Tax=Abyssicoccus albus TaxID=1817405 RepID=UPI00097E341D|nr:hypothetical protein [Abyssicoccus albus]AQL56094.1 hypothetical protein BVH56_03760 [Abyssicoccus albus]
MNELKKSLNGYILIEHIISLSMIIFFVLLFIQFKENQNKVIEQYNQKLMLSRHLFTLSETYTENITNKPIQFDEVNSVENFIITLNKNEFCIEMENDNECKIL